MSKAGLLALPATQAFIYSLCGGYDVALTPASVIFKTVSDQTTDDTQQKIHRQMKQFFKELFEYSHHFNQNLADVFKDNQGKTSEKAEKLFNHILNAHQIWNNRIDPKQPTFDSWELHDIQDLKNIDKTNYEQTLQILDKFDLNETINYSNSKRQAFSNNIRDILFHVINHSTYHRGQVASEFRQYGLEPLVTDYIFYKR